MRDIDEISKSAELGIFIGESSYRNQGIGNCVFDIFVDKIAKFFDLSRIYLRVLAFNKNALNLYQHAGFVIDKIEQKAVCKNGEFVDVIFMSKVF